MEIQNTAKGFCLILALALASAASAVTYTATATISPTQVDAGATTTFTFVLTNTGDGALGSATVVPNGFTVDAATLTASSPAGKPWTAQMNQTGTVILLYTISPDATHRLAEGEAVTVVFSATAPTPSEDHVYQWYTNATPDLYFPGSIGGGASIGFAISSQPTVTVKAPETVVTIDPGTLNLRSKGGPITCSIRLSEGYDVADIDVESILLDDQIGVATKSNSSRLWFDLQDSDDDGAADTLMVKFDRSAVATMLAGQHGDVTLTVTGALTDGPTFTGTAVITVQ